MMIHICFFSKEHTPQRSVRGVDLIVLYTNNIRRKNWVIKTFSVKFSAKILIWDVETWPVIKFKQVSIAVWNRNDSRKSLIINWIYDAVGESPPLPSSPSKSQFSRLVGQNPDFLDDLLGVGLNKGERQDVRLLDKKAAHEPMSLSQKQQTRNCSEAVRAQPENFLWPPHRKLEWPELIALKFSAPTNKETVEAIIWGSWGL